MNTVKIDYKKLRQTSPETARMAVIEYLSSNGGKVSECSRVFGVNRTIIYDILRKNKEGDLKDRSKAPKYIPHKTSSVVEELIVQVAKQTNLPPKRLGYHLLKYYGLDIAYGTLRHILRRNRSRIW